MKKVILFSLIVSSVFAQTTYIVEDYAKGMAKKLHENLPITVDEISRLIDVSVDGKTIKIKGETNLKKYEQILGLEWSKTSEEQKQLYLAVITNMLNYQQATALCQDNPKTEDDTMAYIKKGLILEYVYNLDNEEPFTKVVIDKSSCEKIEELKNKIKEEQNESIR